VSNRMGLHIRLQGEKDASFPIRSFSLSRHELPPMIELLRRCRLQYDGQYLYSQGVVYDIDDDSFTLIFGRYRK